MKLYKTLIVTIMFTLLLSACGTSESTSTNDTDNKASMSAEEILEKSIEAMSGINSYSMDMKMKQTMSMSDEGEINTEMNMKSDMIIEPLQIYMYQEIKSPELGTDEAMTTESYITTDEFYMKDSFTNSWMKYSDDFADDITELQEEQMNPEEQLEFLKQFITSISVEEDADHYILNLNVDGEELLEIVLEITGLFEESLAPMEELLNNVEIQTFTYKIYIDKQTFYQTKMDVITDMVVNEEGNTMKMKQVLEATISNFNGINEITIPQEAIDSAEDFSFESMFDLEDIEGLDLEDFELDLEQ